MIARANALSQEREELLVREYLEGSSVWQLQMRHMNVTRQQLIDLMHNRGVMRPRAQLADPTPEQIVERAAEIRAKWSEKEAKQRYVGRGYHHSHSGLVGEGR